MKKIGRKSQEGFFPVPQKKERKPETSNSSSSTSSLTTQQFSQALQPPNFENQRQSQIEQEIKSTETDQIKIDFSLPQPRASNYMKIGNQKIGQKQKNDEQLIIEQLMKSKRNLQEEVQILKKENQKLLKKSQNNEERLMKQEIEVKLLGEKNLILNLS